MEAEEYPTPSSGSRRMPIPPLETLHAVEEEKKDQVYQLLGQLNRMEDGGAALIHESVNLLRRVKMDYLSVSTSLGQRLSKVGVQEATDLRDSIYQLMADCQEMSKLLRARLLDIGEDGFSVSDTYVSGQVEIPLLSSQHVSRQLFQRSPAGQSMSIPTGTFELPRTPLPASTAQTSSTSISITSAPSPSRTRSVSLSSIVGVTSSQAPLMSVSATDVNKTSHVFSASASTADILTSTFDTPQTLQAPIPASTAGEWLQSLSPPASTADTLHPQLSQRIDNPAVKKSVHFGDRHYRYKTEDGYEDVKSRISSSSSDTEIITKGRSPLYSDLNVSKLIGIPPKQKVKSYLNNLDETDTKPRSSHISAQEHHNRESYASRATSSSRETSPGYYNQPGRDYNQPSCEYQPGRGQMYNSRLKDKLKEDLMFNPRNPYGGEGYTFWAWKKRMQHAIHEAGLASIDALSVIQRNTSNRPKTIVDNLIASNACPDTTLELVWETLTSRFGSHHRLAEEMFSKIERFPCIKSLKNQTTLLEDLLDLCRLINANIPHSNELNSLNYPSGMYKILDKLPEYAHDRWRTYWHQFECDTGRDPDFPEFQRFLSELTREFSKPVRTVARATRSMKTLVTGVESTDHSKKVSAKKCMLHTSSTTHSSSECKTLCKMPYPDVKKMAFDNRLCFKCLEPHMASNCKTTLKCQKCQRHHATALHPPSSTPTPNENNHTKGSGPPGTLNLCTALRHPHTKLSTCSKTLLVDIKCPSSNRIFKCLCIVDEQSNSSLIDPSVINYLNIKPPKITYSITTLGGVSQNVEGFLVSGLEVKGHTEDQWIKLPDLFSNSSIPDTKSEMATSDIVRAQTHVSRFANRFLDANRLYDYEVLLLVGNNCGPAMATRPYGGHAPFVHHTALGWALLGPICLDNPHNYNHSSVVLKSIVHSEHVSANVEFDPYDFCKQLDRVDDELPGLSRNDKSFNNILSITQYIIEQ